MSMFLTCSAEVQSLVHDQIEQMKKEENVAAKAALSCANMVFALAVKDRQAIRVLTDEARGLETLVERAASENLEVKRRWDETEEQLSDATCGCEEAQAALVRLQLEVELWEAHSYSKSPPT